MPAATTYSSKVIQKVRSPSYYGLKGGKNYKRAKPSPWVDVSDDDTKTKQNGLKRKPSIMNVHSDPSQNGHKVKKRRHSIYVNDGGQPNNFNDSGQTKKHRLSTAGPSTPQVSKFKSIQDQRQQLPIAKGVHGGS